MKRLTPCHNVTDALRSFGLDPDTWTGTYRCYVVGKTGEALFSLGCVPGLRYLLPKARLVWHLADHYAPVVDFVDELYRPDAVEGIALPAGTSWAEQIRKAVVHEGALDCERLIGIGYDEDRDELATNAYRTHSWYWWDSQVAGRRTPFYLMFAEALGLPVSLYERPRSSGRLHDGNIALAFPTANVHSRIRQLPVSPATWEKIADRALDAELVPVATGRREDGALEMPGWTWDDAPGVRPVLHAITKAQWVVGLNSGIVFAALLLAPGSGYVSMVDPQDMLLYSFDSMHGIVDGTRHRQRRVHPLRDGAKIEAFMLEEATRALSSRRLSESDVAAALDQRAAFDRWLREEYRR